MSLAFAARSRRPLRRVALLGLHAEAFVFARVLDVAGRTLLAALIVGALAFAPAPRAAPAVNAEPASVAPSSADMTTRDDARFAGPGSLPAPDA